VAGRAVPIPSARQRVLLAALLLAAGRPVSVEGLAEAIWADAQPRHVRRAVQLHVVRLRCLLAGSGLTDLIVTCPGGYFVDVSVEQTDLGRFGRWLAEADRAVEHADLHKEALALGEAAALWRGEPLADVPSESLQCEAVPWLREQRLRTVERRIEVDIRRGRNAEVVAELLWLTTRYPLREGLWAQLITALHRGGRRAEALAVYQSARRRLRAELGLDPGQHLQRLQAMVLAGDP
jgi:DNA-binding SARP family transcriptional activator